MEEKIQISRQELESLLNNESTAAQALETYFESTGAFGVGYQLKDQVEVVDQADRTRSVKGFLIHWAIKRANFAAREQRAEYYETVKVDRKRIRIVSEGDSWFQYPRFRAGGIVILKNVEDVIDHLMKDEAFAIKSLDAASDLLRNMYHQSEYIRIIREEEARVLLLSAGGNDFFEAFPYMVKEHAAGHNLGADLDACLKGACFTELAVLKLYYQALLREIIQAFPVDKQPLDIIIHGYDYIIPQKEGRWIGRHMRKAGIEDQADRERLIKHVIDLFNTTMKEITQDPAFQNRVHYLDLRNSVVPADPKEELWHDEIHPSNKGFEMVAARFNRKIKEIVKPTLIQS